MTAEGNGSRAGDGSGPPAAMRFQWNSKRGGWAHGPRADRPLPKRSISTPQPDWNKPGKFSDGPADRAVQHLLSPPDLLATQRNSYRSPQALIESPRAAPV